MVGGRHPVLTVWAVITHHIFDIFTKQLLINRELFCLHKNLKLSLCLGQNWDVPKVLIMTQELLPFIPSIRIMCYSHPVIPSTHSAFRWVHGEKRRSRDVCVSRAEIGVMLISLVLTFSSDLACNQYFNSSTAVIKDTSQSLHIGGPALIWDLLFPHVPFLTVFGFSLVSDLMQMILAGTPHGTWKK